MTTPTFPTYTGRDIPSTLHPWNPWHYWLLLKWVYFQPSKLRHYLNHALPELYLERGIKNLLRVSLRPTILSFYLMSPVLAFVVGVVLVLITSAIQGTELHWEWLVGGLVVGVVVGIVLGTGLGMGLGMGLGVASGVVGGAAFGAALGLAGGVAGGAAFGDFGAALGVVGGVALGLALGVAFGVTFFGAAWDMVFGVAFLGVALGTLFGVTDNVVFGVMLGVTVGLGGVRIPLYLLELPLCYTNRWLSGDPWQQLRYHPAWWDELTVLPLPGLVPLLQRCLEQDTERTLPLLPHLAANPFQRWAVQKALSLWLNQHPDPLASLYQLSHCSALDDYFLMPAERAHTRSFPTGRELLLAEISQENVRDRFGDPMDNWVWRLTRRLRRTTPSPVAALAGLLYWCLRRADWLKDAAPSKIAATLQQEENQVRVRAVAHLRQGQEIVASFQLITQGLAVNEMADIAVLFASDITLSNPAEPVLRPAVIAVLKALRDVSREVANGLQATSQSIKNRALNRISGALQEVAEHIEANVLPPEQVLLARLVGHWRNIIAQEQGKLGAEALQALSPRMRREQGLLEREADIWRRPAAPLDNPYIAGAPVAPPLFVGRTDIFNKIEEVWGKKDNPDSIILYGHRRMGKSSILRNLDQVASHQTLIAYADMQGETSFVASTEDLLLGLADRLFAAVANNFPGTLAQPQPDDYNTPARASRSFSVLTDQVRALLDGKSLILALDEFEAVEKAVEQNKIGREIYQFLRSKSMEPGLTLVFGGLHTLDEMSRDYLEPFYGSYENIKVSYLSHQEAWRLITNPNEDFALNYEPEAVERIIAETGRQPYLVQLLCREALDHLNHELFDLHQEREVLIRLADVTAILDEGLFKRGLIYFDGVWSQAGQSVQRDLLRRLAQQNDPWTWDAMLAASGLEERQLREVLRWAERQDILQRIGETWQFYVPLMRQWLRGRGNR